MKTSASIPEEIIIEILSLLPLEPIHRFKRVSKTWLALITHHIFTKKLPSSVSGFFYDITGYEYHIHHHLFREDAGKTVSTNFNGSYISSNDIIDDGGKDPTLFFLPPASSDNPDPRIFDSCNGLVLCGSIYKPALYVCNPATKSWTRLPKPYNQFKFNAVMLDFNPWVSPHYRIVSLRLVGYKHSLLGCENRAVIDVYSSQTRKWEHHKRISYERRRNWVSCIGISKFCALWNGDVYLVDTYGSFYGFVRRILRFRTLDGTCEIIIPPGTERPGHNPSIGIWKSRNKLCYANLDGKRIRVWSLSRNQENKWVMDHTSTISNITKYDPPEQFHHTDFPPPRIVGYHPLEDVVFILFKSTIFPYDLKEKSVGKVTWIGTKAYQVRSVTLFPFSSCFCEVLEDGEDY